MKKDVYPDVRIEIISEGLTKKILESSGSPAPAVYGEEQPEGKNLPNVSIKGKNKELQSVLETSNKKPTYTGLVKEAIQELRKDGHDKKGKVAGTATSYTFPAYEQGYKRQDDLRDVVSQIRSAGVGYDENIGNKPYTARRQAQVLYGQENTPLVRDAAGELDQAAAMGYLAYEDPKALERLEAYGSRMPFREDNPYRKTVPSEKNIVKETIQELRKQNYQETYQVGAKKPELTSFASEGAEGQYGQFQPGGQTKTKTPVIRGGTGLGGRETDAPLTEDRVDVDLRRQGTKVDDIGEGGTRTTKAMVKEAIQELRKSKKKVSELSKDNGPMVGSALTTSDVISNINTAVSSGGSLDAGTVKEITNNPQKYQTELTSLFDKGTQEQKLQVGFGALASGLPKVADSDYTPPPPEAGLPTLDQTLATKVPTTSEAGPAPASTPGPSILGEPGAGGLGTPRPEGGPSNTVVLDPKTQGATAPDRRNRGKGPSSPTGDSGMPGYTPIGEENLLIEGPPDPFENVDTSVLAELDKKNKEGFSSTSLSPEILRPKGTGDRTLPEFQSSGYFSAVLALGNLNDPSATDKQKENAMKDYGLTGLSSDGSSISPLSEFLSLYAQNESQFDQNKFLENIGEMNKADLEKADIKNPFRAALKKQAPPMAMTMNRPPNMGVGVQQPVVTGAGTMKNVEKDVAANKPAATPARTKARRTAAGSIEQRKEKAYIARQAQKALIKSGMVWDQINKQWVPMSKG